MIDEVMIREVIENLVDFDMVVALLSGAVNLISLLTFVLTSYSIFTIAKRRDISNPWLAWVPVIQLWVVGAIADDYQQKVHHMAGKKRKVLLLTMILNVVLTVALVVAILWAVLMVLRAGYHSYEDFSDWLGVIGGLGGLILVIALAGGVKVVQKVVEYFALYDVYRSCDPGNALLFVLVNVFFAITKPIFLLICHKKDGGMPAEPKNPEAE